MTIEEEIEKRENKKRDGIQLILYISLLVLISFFIVKFVGQRTVVSGESMEATLNDGDNLIIDKICYRISDQKRFEVVVFPNPMDKSVYFIKRIIGLPGETVKIDGDGKIYINGSVLHENYGREVINNPGRAAETITLGKDEYFVMGDNRNNSLDSRFEEVGNIHRDDFIGRAWVRIYPFGKFKDLLPD